MACISPSTVPTGQPQPKALRGRFEYSSGSTSPQFHQTHHLGEASHTSEESYRAGSVHQVRRWDVRVPNLSIRPGAKQQVDLMSRRQFHGVSTWSPCTCACGICGAAYRKDSFSSMRCYAVPAEKSAPAAAPSFNSKPLIPYDSDENSASGPGLAPFVPPPIEKLINMIMRHGKKDIARGIVFDASHALYNAARSSNPRPELQQRRKEYVPK